MIKKSLCKKNLEFPKLFTGNPSWISSKDGDLGRVGNWFVSDLFERVSAYLSARGPSIGFQLMLIALMVPVLPFLCNVPSNYIIFAGV